MNAVLVGILAYVALQVAIGALVARRIHTEDDYLVGGRKVGPLLVGGSIFATWFGAETCIGAAGTMHAEGIGLHSVEPFAYGLCLVLTGFIFVRPLWKRRITTLADFLGQRFSPSVERLAALLLIPTSLLWAAAQIRAFGQVLASATPISLEVAIALATFVAITYTALGGLLADLYTDLVQALVLILGLVLLALVIVTELGGPGAAWAAVEARPRVATQLGAWDLLEAWAIPICGSIVAQEVLQRALSARSPSVAQWSTISGGIVYLVVGLVPVFLGLVAASLLGQISDSESVLPQLAARYLGTLPYVLFAGALISAILSTVDSALLVAASLLARNLVFEALPGLNRNERQRLRVARASVIFLGLAAWWLASGVTSVADLVEDASGFGSAGILVTMSFGLFTRIGGATAAWASLLSGAGAWILGRYGGAFEHPYLVSLGAALAGYLGGCVLSIGRAGGIRTHDPQLPKLVR